MPDTPSPSVIAVELVSLLGDVPLSTAAAHFAVQWAAARASKLESEGVGYGTTAWDDLCRSMPGLGRRLRFLMAASGAPERCSEAVLRQGIDELAAKSLTALCEP